MEAFPQYQDVKSRVETIKTDDEPEFTAGMSIEEKMDLV
jgi:hypothetical protein